MARLAACDLKSMAPEVLFQRWRAVQRRLADAKADQEVMQAELVRRYLPRATAALALQQGKTAGTVHLTDRPLDVAVEIRSRDVLDQPAMAAAVAALETKIKNWREWVQVDYLVSRTTLKAMPAPLRALFAPAISEQLDKPRFTLRKAAGVERLRKLAARAA